jgi:predicted TIM-barrel fold metal-dependent hydrolase
LPAVARLTNAQPGVVVALDHCAFPDLDGGPPYRRAAPLLELASVSAIHLKVTTIVLDNAAPHGGARSLVAQLADAFSPARMSWGSDHPQTYELPYKEMVQLALDATADLSPEDRAAVLDTTARRLWFGGR